MGQPVCQPNPTLKANAPICKYARNSSVNINTKPNSTLPRPLTGGGQGYAPRARHGAVRRGVLADDGSGSPTKSLTDYEREISELRSAMEGWMAFSIIFFWHKIPNNI